MELEEAINRLKYIDMAYDCNNYYSRYDLNCIEIILKELENSISKDKIKENILKLDKEYKEILSDYGNIDTDVIINIPNQNVRKLCDKIVEKITILQELLEE